MADKAGLGDGLISRAEPVRDEQAALAAAGGDSVLAGELIETLVTSLPGELSRIRTLFDERDWPGVDEAAHRLRGATLYCGVPALDSAARALSLAAKSGDEARVRIEVNGVEEEARRLREAVGRDARLDPEGQEA